MILIGLSHKIFPLNFCHSVTQKISLELRHPVVIERFTLDFCHPAAQYLNYSHWIIAQNIPFKFLSLCYTKNFIRTSSPCCYRKIHIRFLSPCCTIPKLFSLDYRTKYSLYIFCHSVAQKISLELCHPVVINRFNLDFCRPFAQKGFTLDFRTKIFTLLHKSRFTTPQIYRL
jgi:hypothetical protein